MAQAKVKRDEWTPLSDMPWNQEDEATSKPTTESEESPSISDSFYAHEDKSDTAREFQEELNLLWQRVSIIIPNFSAYFSNKDWKSITLDEAQKSELIDILLQLREKQRLFLENLVSEGVQETVKSLSKKVLEDLDSALLYFAPEHGAKAIMGERFFGSEKLFAIFSEIPKFYKDKYTIEPFPFTKQELENASHHGFSLFLVPQNFHYDIFNTSAAIGWEGGELIWTFLKPKVDESPGEQDVASYLKMLGWMTEKQMAKVDDKAYHLRSITETNESLSRLLQNVHQQSHRYIKSSSNYRYSTVFTSKVRERFINKEKPQS